MNTKCTLLVLFFTFQLMAQDYLPVQLGQQSYYQTAGLENWDWGSCENGDCVLGIQIDSLNTSSDSVTYYFYKMLRQTDFGLCEADSWLGEKLVVYANGDHVYRNKMDNTILLKPSATLGTSWSLSELEDGAYVEATIVEKAEVEILGLLDSVCRIELMVKDSMGLMLEHELNETHIAVGQQIGFVETLNFYDFPETTSSTDLIGFSNDQDYGLVPPSFAEIFNFEVGTEFHYYQYSETEWIPIDRYTRYEIVTVLDKYVSTELDTFSYTLEVQVLNITDMSGESIRIDSSIYTYNQIYSKTKYGHLEALPYQIHAFDTDIYSFSELHLEEDEIIVTSQDYFFYEEPNCLSSVVGQGVFWERSYKPCLGNFFEEDRYSVYFREMVYYKKGEEEWGIPLDLNALDVDEYYLPESSFEVFPNPVETTMNIQSSSIQNDFITIELFDLSGQLLFQENRWFNGAAAIKIPSPYNGLGVLNIKTSEGIYTEKILFLKPK